MKIAVLAGGTSGEREVSLRSGVQIRQALAGAGHQVDHVDLDAQVWDRLRDGGYECVFVALHGRPGEDGTVQGMLELLRLPYTGSGVLASALCIDKVRTNRTLSQVWLCIPEFEELEYGQAIDAKLIDRFISAWGFPLVVKPVREGSTLGLTIARDPDQLAAGIQEAWAHDQRVMVQQCALGVEITVGVLATPEIEVLPTLEIVSSNPVYDYDAKYTAGRSRHLIPARIPQPAQEAAASAASRAFAVLGCEGMARVDMIVDDRNRPWILEVNTVPGMTELSLLPDAARAAGIDFAALCERLVEHAVALGPR